MPFNQNLQILSTFTVFVHPLSLNHIHEYAVSIKKILMNTSAMNGLCFFIQDVQNTHYLMVVTQSRPQASAAMTQSA
jgi:hypothetical protein